MTEKDTHFIPRLLKLEDSPERIAKAFALGVFLAFSPLIGLHPFLGLTLPFLFNLNRLAFLLGWFVLPIVFSALSNFAALKLVRQRRTRG